MANETHQDNYIAETMQDLRRIFKAIQDYSREVNSKFKITGPQLWALKAISENSSLPIGELSKMMYLHPSTVTGIVDRLEKKGYALRERSIEDRRVVKVKLTSEGDNLVKKAPNPAQGKMIYGLRKMGEKDLELIHKSVHKLVEIMEVQDLEVTFFFDKE
jgi:MarR family transcriptional regulator, organic hydroperoxide resistance regulator